MIIPNWNPSHVVETEAKWAHIKLPTYENISHTDAERLMIAFLDMRNDWVSEYENALYHQNQMDFKYNSAYRIAYTKAEEKSHNAKDIVAKSAPEVLVAEMRLEEARISATVIKMRIDGIDKGHHAVKDIFRAAAQERSFL